MSVELVGLFLGEEKDPPAPLIQIINQILLLILVNLFN
jgi:hypothetical protein